jgi:Ca2+-binding EF-hand superfamily protein
MFFSQDTFYRFDSDRSGNIDAQELQQTLAAFGYNLSPQAIGAIVRHFATDGKIVFDSFVACCVRLKVLTTSFQQRDTMRNGSATFRYDDFIQVVMGI